MQKRYQIDKQRAVQQFRRLATETNPNIQMILPLAGIAGMLQEGVGHLMEAEELDHESRSTAPGRTVRSPGADPAPAECAVSGRHRPQGQDLSRRTTGNC